MFSISLSEFLKGDIGKVYGDNAFVYKCQFRFAFGYRFSSAFRDEYVLSKYFEIEPDLDHGSTSFLIYY